MQQSGQSTLEPLAIVAGLRTPFAKAFGALSKTPADELGRIVVQTVLQQSELTPTDVDEVIFGNVAGPADASNVARVIALRAGIPYDRVAHTVNRNCASGMESIFSAWQTIREGRARLVVAGGTESMSNVPLLWDPGVKDLLVEASRRKSLWKKVALIGRLRPSHLKPVAALEVGLTDPTCGLNMGQTAEVLANEFSISRDEQDRFALASHQRALAAWGRCFFKGEVVPIPADAAGGRAVDKDIGPRDGQSLGALAKLRPIFDSKAGTVTAGNSCQITDGAAAVVLMSAREARTRGLAVLGYVRDYALGGVDPRRMGLGPVIATSKLLDRTGLRLQDFDLYEINEAFAAQVLACVKAMKSPEFARDQLGRDEPLGELDPERLNVNGGAIALGHPVGTSGTRLIITLLRALREKGLRRGLASLCVGGGQGAAVWVETDLEEQ